MRKATASSIALKGLHYLPFALIAFTLVFSSCRKECRELGNGNYWYQDEDGPDGPGPCLLPKDREHPKPFVAIMGPYHENEYSIDQPISIEVLFGDNRKLDRATISISADGLADGEYYRTTFDLNGKRDTFRHELQLTGRDMLGPHHFRVTVEDEFGLTDTRENVFMVIDNWKPEFVDAWITEDLGASENVEFKVSFRDFSGIASIRAEFFFAEDIFSDGGLLIGQDEMKSLGLEVMEFSGLPDEATFNGIFTTGPLPYGKLHVVFTATDGAGITRTKDRYVRYAKY